LDSHLDFSISAVFIGANLAFAAISFFGEKLDYYCLWPLLEFLLIFLVFFSAIMSILSSTWFCESKPLAYIAIAALLFVYIIVFFLSLGLLTSRTIGDRKQAQYIFSSHKPNH
jgi:hypothetical protein